VRHVAVAVRKHGVEVRSGIAVVRTPTGYVVHIVVDVFTGVAVVTCIVPALDILCSNEVENYFAFKDLFYVFFKSGSSCSIVRVGGVVRIVYCDRVLSGDRYASCCELFNSLGKFFFCLLGQIPAVEAVG